jgi:predicted anti-sigma-YlaC factor YlaD
VSGRLDFLHLTWLGCRPAARLALAAALLVLPGCSVRQMAVRSLGDALAEGGGVFITDDDPELVRDALPFALKTMEMLLAEQPHHQGLLLAASQGFALYARGFVELEAERLEPADFGAARQQRERALGLYLRARDYALSGLELRHPGISAELRRQPADAVARLGSRDAELAYWAGAAWGGALGVGRHRPDLLADLGAVRSLFERVLALDEELGDGAVHEVFITLSSPALGGSRERAREHFQRAVELSGGASAGPYVTYAEAVARPAQDREEFAAMLQQALDVDPDAVPELRLLNILTQRRARWLLDRIDDYFLPAFDEDEDWEAEQEDA